MLNSKFFDMLIWLGTSWDSYKWPAKKILIELLQDCSGVELARIMLHRADSADPDTSEEGPSVLQGGPFGQNNLNWFRCGKCHPMVNLQKQVCCKIPTCVTSTETFHDVVLNRSINQTFYQYMWITHIMKNLFCSISNYQVVVRYMVGFVFNVYR